MEEIILYMLVFASWTGNAESVKIERLPQLYASQEMCEAAGRQAQEAFKADRKLPDRRTAFECLSMPGSSEFEAAFAEAHQQK